MLALKFWNGREASPYFWDLGEGERMRTDIRVSAMAYTSSLLVAESGRQAVKTWKVKPPRTAYKAFPGP